MVFKMKNPQDKWISFSMHIPKRNEILLSDFFICFDRHYKLFLRVVATGIVKTIGIKLFIFSKLGKSKSTKEKLEAEIVHRTLKP